MTFYAHTACLSGGKLNPNRTYWQSQRDHLRQVADLAIANSRPIGMEVEAELAGLLHDLGKYSKRFQQRLRDPAVTGINHWAAGAYHAYSALKAKRVAFAIDGHHTGIPSPDSTGSQHFDNPSLRETITKFAASNTREEFSGCSESDDDLIKLLRADGLSLPVITPAAPQKDKLFEEALKIRFLFSCLVDADYLDTENHFTPWKTSFRRALPLDAKRALVVIRERLKYLSEIAVPGPVNTSRTRLLNDCLSAAERDASLFTLTAPTGSGKTLASMAFALRHIEHKNVALEALSFQKLRRVIVVIPYTSIIEQTARIYKDLFGEASVLEHHGSVDPKDQRFGYWNRIAVENWDAPIVITTSVQFFESLFSNRPFKCRKLHNIARSVILFDEVQTLPIHLLPSLLSAVKLLTAEPYGCTAVFMTATQPAFSAVGHVLKPGGWSPVEISSDPYAMAENLKRTQIILPRDNTTLTADELTKTMIQGDQALCVVNTTDYAAEIFNNLRAVVAEADHVSHLSSRMCPAHRQEKLHEIRIRLRERKTTYLVSTQLIEAGVDIDFPVAFRAMGPLDSIIQTAGRCNREGRFDGPCPVTVFRPASNKMPPGSYQKASSVTEQFLTRYPDSQLHQPETYQKYFRELYLLERGSDPVIAACEKLDFPLMNEQCRLIDEETRAVLVKWKRGEELLAKLISERLLTADECRETQRFSVNLFQHRFQKGLEEGTIYQPDPEWEIFVWNSNYDPDLGICSPTEFIF